jgi:hypothetical protein
VDYFIPHNHFTPDSKGKYAQLIRVDRCLPARTGRRLWDIWETGGPLERGTSKGETQSAKSKSKTPRTAFLARLNQAIRINFPRRQQASCTLLPNLPEVSCSMADECGEAVRSEELGGIHRGLHKSIASRSPLDA